MSNDGISRAELQRRLDALRQGTLPEADIYRTVHQFGWQHFLEARVDVERLLTHHKPRLRYIALEVLTTHWNLEEHWETALKTRNMRRDQREWLCVMRDTFSVPWVTFEGTATLLLLSEVMEGLVG